MLKIEAECLQYPMFDSLYSEDGVPCGIPQQVLEAKGDLVPAISVARNNHRFTDELEIRKQKKFARKFVQGQTIRSHEWIHYLEERQIATSAGVEEVVIEAKEQRLVVKDGKISPRKHRLTGDLNFRDWLPRHVLVVTPFDWNDLSAEDLCWHPEKVGKPDSSNFLAGVPSSVTVVVNINPNWNHYQ